MIGLDISASAKLEVIWIITPRLLLHGEPNIRFGLSYFFFFCCKFCTFRVSLFYNVSFLILLSKTE